jgi:hypothetical protein
VQSGKIMRQILRGVAAGVGASIIQVIIGRAEEKLLPLPDHEDANIAPRFVDRLAEKAGIETSSTHNWALGTLFHFGYAAFWGAGYALVVQDRKVPPLLGGTLLGGLIYSLAFTRWGVAVQSKAERPPEKRTTRMSIVAWSVALSYGVATGLLYHWPKARR